MANKSLTYGIHQSTLNRYYQMFYRFTEGKSVNEVADEFGCSYQTVYNAIEVVTEKVIGAPPDSKVGYLVHRSKKRAKKLEEIADSLQERIIKFDETAQKAITPAEGQKPSYRVFMDLQDLVVKAISEIRKCQESLRQEEEQLSLYWGAIKQSSREVVVKNTQNNFYIDGKAHARMADLARKFREEITAPQIQNEPS